MMKAHKDKESKHIVAAVKAQIGVKYAANSEFRQVINEILIQPNLEFGATSFHPATPYEKIDYINEMIVYPLLENYIGKKVTVGAAAIDADKILEDFAAFIKDHDIDELRGESIFTAEDLEVAKPTPLPSNLAPAMKRSQTSFSGLDQLGEEDGKVEVYAAPIAVPMHRSVMGVGRPNPKVSSFVRRMQESTNSSANSLDDILGGAKHLDIGKNTSIGGWYVG